MNDAVSDRVSAGVGFSLEVQLQCLSVYGVVQRCNLMGKEISARKKPKQHREMELFPAKFIRSAGELSMRNISDDLSTRNASDEGGQNPGTFENASSSTRMFWRSIGSLTLLLLIASAAFVLTALNMRVG